MVVPNGVIEGKVNLQFVPIGFDNPKVDAIILYKGKLDETDFDTLPKKRKIIDEQEA